MFSFKLTDDFVAPYRAREVPWGYRDAAGNAFGELVFIDKYSRLKPDGTKERWWEVCERVTNGTYTIQKDHAKDNRLPWNDFKAQTSAREFFDRMFRGLWVPPGRGLAQMGAPLVMDQRNSASLQNCAFVSTSSMTTNDPARPFAFLMEASMLGIGVGFDTDGVEKGFKVHGIIHGTEVFPRLISDTREGWVESVRVLINFWLKPSMARPWFDYSAIRPAGAPIKTFGGTAAGPEPLIRLHRLIDEQFDGREGQSITTIDILDLANKIGACVVAGNVRRSAELALGKPDDKDFINAKNAHVFPVRNSYDASAPGWGWMSNNSLDVTVGTDYTPFVDAIAHNGEPGLVWMDVSRQYGRMVDPPTGNDWRSKGVNPCAEQTLESWECCTLVETFISRHESLDDFRRTLKFAYLYAKTVTLLPTHWPETNAVMQRNRRIGCSVSGIAEFADSNGNQRTREWLDAGYTIVKHYDRIYSEWLCVRESIKMTSVKPSGTVSLLFGVTPGVHWAPGGEYFLRALRVAKDNPLLPRFATAGYTIEDDVTDPVRTAVVYFPIHSGASRSEKDVSMWEKAMLAVLAQRYWADNSVSVTVSFDAEKEGPQIPGLLHAIEGQVKTLSFLPMSNRTYPQQPYTQITAEEYDRYRALLAPIDTDVLYASQDMEEAAGEAFCTTDRCEMPVRTPVPA